MNLRCVAVIENGEGDWSVYQGMNGQGPLVGEYGAYDDPEDALEDVYAEHTPSTMLVIEHDETSGYTRKYEAAGLTFKQAGAA